MTDLFGDSAFHMADVGGKSPSQRRALAMGRILVGPSAFSHIANSTLPKGDVLKIAEIAGITGAKKCADLIPLCHPLPLDHVAIRLVLEQETSSVAVYALVSCFAKTGVEMEAISAVNAALITLYDLTKPVEPALTITDVSLLLKEGGKKGRWVRHEGLPEEVAGFVKSDKAEPLAGVRAAVITLSDRASRGQYEDKSGPALIRELKALGAEVKERDILPDDGKALADKVRELCDAGLVDLILTTGGTGLTPRDVTPEALEPLFDKKVPGLGELLRTSGARHITSSWLSRSLAGVRGKTLVIALPGSTKAVVEGMEALRAVLPHAVRLASGGSCGHGSHS